ncbi:MAG: 50S ribosomal protein L18 [Candidatus Vogelbacteria bacterium]|nr:50S ribosomal protein L18 [Candidatus Vogelbacteria bacterium]
MRIKRFKTKKEKRERRHMRVRASVIGTALRPRLSVFRSNKHIMTQLIDDETGKTLVAASSAETKGVKNKKGDFVKIKQSEEVGQLLAERAKVKKIVQAVFDRGGYRYTGRVKAVAEGARAGGLEF